MRRELLLGIDGGTTAVKAVAYDLELRPLARASRRLTLSHPRPGWVEQDGEALLAATVQAVAEVLSRVQGHVVAAGLDHQGESVIAWDAADGRALTPVVLWQDKRQEELLARLDASVLSERSGLPVDPYFSAGKLAWLLEHDAEVRAARARGRLRLGTLDAFLRARLQHGESATDLSTASRTQLLALGGRDWDAQLLQAFGLEGALLPRIGPSFGELGRLAHPDWPQELPLRAQLVDQQAALAGAGAVAPGMLKATYGTGVFVLARTEACARVEGLLATIAWAGPDGEPAYALDGGVFTAGALLDWLAQGLGLARDTPALLAAARAVDDSAGVRLLPALAGLGAPWWRPGARAVVAGLHGGVRAGHLARAALEAIAWRVAEIVEAMALATPIEEVRLDGGLSAEPLLASLQADALGMPVRAGPPDATARGAALLAGVGAGVFASVEQAATLLAPGRVIEPSLGKDERARLRARWGAFVEASSAL